MGKKFFFLKHFPHLNGFSFLLCEDENPCHINRTPLKAKCKGKSRVEALCDFCFGGSVFAYMSVILMSSSSSFQNVCADLASAVFFVQNTGKTIKLVLCHFEVKGAKTRRKLRGISF